MGGIALLGKGVTNSGLLETMDEIIRDLVDGFSLYAVVLIAFTGCFWFVVMTANRNMFLTGTA